MILALDLATTVGFATASRDAVFSWPHGMALEGAVGPTEGVHYGSHRLARAGAVNDEVYDAMYTWLEEFCAVSKPQTIVFEAALPPGASRNRASAVRGMGLVAIVEFFGRRQKIRRVYEVHLGTVKATFAGTGRASKQDMIATCRRRGWSPKDDNAADALAILDTGVRRLYPPQQRRRAG